MYTLKAMKEKAYSLPPIEWEKVTWEKTPYRDVFIYKAEEKQDPNNPSMPKYTIMALKIEAGAAIPLHRHNRELGWTETIIFPNGGWFATKSEKESKKVETKKPFTIVIQAGEVFGLENIHPSKPLYFYSRMEPGFTGYQEIEEIQEANK